MNVTIGRRTEHFRTVTFDAANNSVRLIEQRLLPQEFKIIGTKDFRETARAITDMIVRGAGAIGATAAYGFAQGVLAFRGGDLKKFSAHAKTVYQTLADARPTAVDPVNAMNVVRREMTRGETVAEKQLLALAAAETRGIAKKSANMARN
jgi:methylthioribose-1-phosphate isomerase